MSSVWKLGGLSWWRLLGRVAKRAIEEDVLGRAAQLAYFFLLSLFPLLLILISLLGLITGHGPALRAELLNFFSHIMPYSAATLVIQTVDEVSKTSGTGKISLGILGTLWAASSGILAIVEGMNTAYHVRETRPWWKVRLVGVFLTIVVTILVVTALGFVFTGTRLADTLAAIFGFGDFFAVVAKIVHWPIALGFILLTLSVMHRIAPAPSVQVWNWISPGSALGLVIWLAVSFGFRTYLRHFDSYNLTYGSLGAVIILMLWFYFTGIAILLGSVTDSEIEIAAAARP